MCIEPETWTHEECTRWLKNVCPLVSPYSQYPRVPEDSKPTNHYQRNLHPSPLATTAELLERIKANMRIARGDQ